MRTVLALLLVVGTYWVLGVVASPDSITLEVREVFPLDAENAFPLDKEDAVEDTSDHLEAKGTQNYILLDDGSKAPYNAGNDFNFEDEDNFNLEDEGNLPDEDNFNLEDEGKSTFEDEENFNLEDGDNSPFDEENFNLEDEDVSPLEDENNFNLEDEDNSSFEDEDNFNLEDEDVSPFEDEDNSSFEDEDNSPFEDGDDFSIDDDTDKVDLVAVDGHSYPVKDTDETAAGEILLPDEIKNLAVADDSRGSLVLRNVDLDTGYGRNMYN